MTGNVVVPSSLLSGSRGLAYARLSPDGRVVDCSGGLAAAVGADACGRRLADLLVESQRRDLAPVLEAGALPGENPVHLHFAQGDDAPISLTTWFGRDEEGGAVLVGDVASADEARSSALLAKLNARVSELARENVKKSVALERALRELREAQARLLHREKMASLGRMTAGVAHELNNPLSFLVNNQFLVRRAFDDLLRLVNEFGDSLDLMETHRPELYSRVISAVREIDLPHLSESIPRLLDGSERGLERSQAIVRDLRLFSRLDEARVKEVDLNDSLRATIELLGPEVEKNGARIEARFGAVPPLTCSPAELNQAFQNLLHNAVQAAGAEGTVTVTTSLRGDEVVVVVEDDGPGVPVELRDRIFEPFFTTKDVGQGVGLGLSIAHTVVAAHGGRIEVGGEPPSGAVFTVVLPVDGAGIGGDGGDA